MSTQNNEQNKVLNSDENIDIKEDVKKLEDASSDVIEGNVSDEVKQNEDKDKDSNVEAEINIDNNEVDSSPEVKDENCKEEASENQDENDEDVIEIASEVKQNEAVNNDKNLNKLYKITKFALNKFIEKYGVGKKITKAQIIDELNPKFAEFLVSRGKMFKSV